MLPPVRLGYHSIGNEYKIKKKLVGDIFGLVMHISGLVMHIYGLVMHILVLKRLLGHSFGAKKGLCGAILVYILGLKMAFGHIL